MEMLTTLELEDLTPKQLRKVLHGLAQAKLPSHRREKEEEEKESEKAESENESLVGLDRERGDSKPPVVLDDDLPESLRPEKKKRVKKKVEVKKPDGEEIDEEEEEEEEED